MSSQQNPGLLAQFFESFFGISWSSEEQSEEMKRAPICSACHNPVKATSEGGWRCSYHPNANVIERDGSHG